MYYNNNYVNENLNAKRTPMKQIVNLQEANQHLSRYIASAKNGDEIIIPRRGKPVARLTAFVEAPRLDALQQVARKRSLSRMKRGYSLGGKLSERESLHDRKTDRP